MLIVSNINTFGWESAIRGMRNPMNSWSKSDSYWGMWEDPSIINPSDSPFFFVGEDDLNLMKRLSKAGNDHAKFLRMIHVSCDIVAPLYWWKEFDTYKVGTVSNSTSTMHKIHSKEFTLDDFSHEHLLSDSLAVLEEVIHMLNVYREAYNSNSFDISKIPWWQMIQLLPSSYNQKRTIDLNYQVLKSIYWARRDHKLDEWHTLCDVCLELPYFKEVCVDVFV